MAYYKVLFHLKRLQKTMENLNDHRLKIPTGYVINASLVYPELRANKHYMKVVINNEWHAFYLTWVISAIQIHLQCNNPSHCAPSQYTDYATGWTTRLQLPA
jgi:hypothetical protein